MRDEVLQALINGTPLTGALNKDVPRFLLRHGCPRTAEHCAAVAAKAAQLAEMLDVDVEAAERAGWLHDVSAVFPVAERLSVAEVLDVTVLPEEASAPMLLHQKLSVILAEEIFGVEDEDVLGAIGCHTTLKPHASPLDKVVFVADKLAWDQSNASPFYDAMMDALRRSLDDAVRVYLTHLWERRATLAAEHPWFVAAYSELVGGGNGNGG